MPDDVSSSTRSPAPRRSRRPLWMALAMVVMAGGIAAAGWLAHEGYLGWRLCYPKTYQPDRARRILARQKEMRVAEAFVAYFWSHPKPPCPERGGVPFRQLDANKIEEWPNAYRGKRSRLLRRPWRMKPEAREIEVDETVARLNWDAWTRGCLEEEGGYISGNQGLDLERNVRMALERNGGGTSGSPCALRIRTKEDRVVDVAMLSLYSLRHYTELGKPASGRLVYKVEWVRILWRDGSSYSDDLVVLQPHVWQ